MPLEISHLTMVALKIFDVLIHATHVYTVHILTDRNSQGCTLRQNARVSRSQAQWHEQRKKLIFKLITIIS